MNQQHPQRPASRIPATLQAVFLASNRGKEVHTPPPQRVAYRVFMRGWWGGQNSNKKKKAAVVTPADPNVESKQSMMKKTAVAAQAPHLSLTTALKPPVPKKIPLEPTPKQLSPQGYLDAMIRGRGYSTKRFKTLQSAYYCKPTPLQVASYDVHLIELVRDNNADQLRAILSCGLSPNPCNAYGESLLHNICRRANVNLLHVLLDCGASLQVSDDFGRTPLHDACWAASPNLTVIAAILQRDVRLLHMTDCRGAVPLSYVRKENWNAMVDFLEAHKDTYWPPRDLANDGEEAVPVLTLQAPHTKPVPDPTNALTCEVAALVAANKMTAEEAVFLKYHHHDDDDTRSETSSDDNDNDDGSSCSSDDGSEFTMDETEMADILSSLHIAPTTPVWSQ